MELRDFAEQVLFATTLDKKLRCPAIITDHQPGPPLAAPEAPGRPVELRFKARVSGTADFPGLHQLEKESERGRLLHFFANHELLATELMALVLLRFPAAPAAFRRGVLATLKDEQLHTRLYLDRMKACGIRFGELPVSGYFWRAVSAMETPMDYVASLSLTFEQANLDFARHFARGFAAVGDADTAQLLDRIYRDEIGHVAHGLKWFRRWKNPGESDWEAFCGQLKFPLSPQRAKGFSLNVEGRRAAGLEPAFIDELAVYSQSKGRTPGVFVFNPFTEGRIAHGKKFMPVKHQAQLARDLANLPQFLCRQDDIVLVEKRPSVSFLSSIKQAGFPLPEFVELDGSPLTPARSTKLVAADVSRRTLSGGEDQRRLTSAATAGEHAPRPFAGLAQRKLGSLRPWAWGPDSMEMLEPLFASVTGEERTEHERFNEGIAQLYSKAWSAVFLEKVLSRAGEIPWLCTQSEIGVAVNSLDAALAAIAAIRARSHHKVAVKEAFGLAGSNMIRLWEPELLETQRRWMANAVENGRQLVVEPWLEREADFSIQLEMQPGGLKLCGYTGLLNDAKGQFRANWAEAGFARRIPAKVLEQLGGHGDVSRRLHQFYGEVLVLLESELRQTSFRGPLGIDAFAYRTAQGDCRLKPVVEINPRHTMGRLTLELMKHACPGTTGVFRLMNRAMVKSAGAESFAAYARRLNETFPVRLEGEPVPRIREGALCLNDPARAKACLAVFQVGRDLDLL